MAQGVNSTGGLTAQGSNLTTTVVQNVLVAPLAAASVFLSSGVPIIDSANPVKIPLAPDPNESVNYVPEGTAIPEIDASLGSLTLLPPTMQPIGAIERFTKQLARQSVVAVDNALQTHLVSSLAGKLDNEFIFGGGDGVTHIKGLLSQPGVQTLNVNGEISVDNVFDALTLLEVAHVPEGGVQLWVTPQVKNKLRKLKTTNGEYLLQPDPSQPGRSTVGGVPLVSTPRLPTVAGTGGAPDKTTAVLWAPAYSRIVRDVAPSVEFLTERYAEFDEIGVKAMTRYDFGVVKPQSVVKLTNVNAS